MPCFVITEVKKKERMDTVSVSTIFLHFLMKRKVVLVIEDGQRYRLMEPFII